MNNKEEPMEVDKPEEIEQLPEEVEITVV